MHRYIFEARVDYTVGDANKDKAPQDSANAKKSSTYAGGLGRKGDGEPGVKAIWQGYDKLLHYIEAADMFGV